MKPDTRGQKLLEIITYGLASYANRNTQTQLGNREEYVGMSDIGSYMTCPRMAVLNRKPDADRSEVLCSSRKTERHHPDPDRPPALKAEDWRCTGCLSP